MPRLVAVQGGMTCVDLGGQACRLGVASVAWQRQACAALVYRWVIPPQYAPPGYVQAPNGQTAFRDERWLPTDWSSVIALVRAPVMASVRIEENGQDASVQTLDRALSVALSGGSYDADLARISESMKMYKNNPRVTDEHVAQAVAATAAVLRLYWDVVSWVAEGAPARMFEVRVPGSTLQGLP